MSIIKATFSLLTLVAIDFVTYIPNHVSQNSGTDESKCVVVVMLSTNRIPNNTYAGCP